MNYVRNGVFANDPAPLCAIHLGFSIDLRPPALLAPYRMDHWKIPLNAPTFDELEINAAKAVLDSGFLTMGARCLDFESAFEKQLATNNAIFVNSGSSANLLAFFLLANHALPLLNGKRRMMPGDEVIVPSLTWSTTVWPIVQAGGIPVLVDSDPMTLQMRPERVRKAISDRTVAICPVHVLGNAVDMTAIQEIAREHRLWVIEDTCESLGTRFQGQPAGTIGDIGTYSFFFSHHITTIEGGMMVTPHDEIAEVARSLRAHGWTRHLKNRAQVEARYSNLDPRYLFVNTGFNLRPTEINAAIGLHQLKKLDRFNAKRVAIANRWISNLSDLIQKGCLFPMRVTPGTDCTWFGFPVLLRSAKERHAFQNYLEEKGIETRPIISGNLARQPVFQHIQHRVSGDLSGADQVMENGIYWASHPVMTDHEIDYVSETVRKFFL